jgi:hypothetical protein
MRQVRRREQDFPLVSRRYGKYEQPLRSPHIDWTAKGAELQLQDAFPGQGHIWRGKDYDIIKYGVFISHRFSSSVPKLTESLVSGDHWLVLAMTGHWLSATGQVSITIMTSC